MLGVIICDDDRFMVDISVGLAKKCIDEKKLPIKVLDRQAVMCFHRLSYRLIQHFKPDSVLGFGMIDPINAAYISAAGNSIECSGNREGNKQFDALFLYTCNGEIPSVDELLAYSRPNTFWVVHSIKNKGGKQLWKQILADERVRVTFDVTETGIAFLHPEHHKITYVV